MVEWCHFSSSGSGTVLLSKNEASLLSGHTNNTAVGTSRLLIRSCCVETMSIFTTVFIVSVVMSVLLVPSPSVALTYNEYIEANADTYVQDLFSLVSIPSISALPERLADVVAAADWLKERLEKAGLENVQTLPTDGPRPVVYGEWLHTAGAPTVLIYGHYDVQPVDPLELWTSPPFAPEIREGYFYGRGVDDDKGGLLIPIHAIEAFLQSDNEMPVNVKFLLEGEEEVGSPYLDAFLIKHKELLQADVALSADGGQPAIGSGAVSLGLRGVAGVQINVTTADTDLHSGKVGGSVQNALHALVAILDSMRAENGTVLVDGFYDAVRGISEVERADMAAFPVDLEEERASWGLKGNHTGQAGYSVLERRWHRPTLEIVGLSGGFTGAGIKTIVPASAFAKLACRLVPYQQPQDILNKISAHISRHTPPGAAVTISPLGFMAPAWDSPRHCLGNRAADAVLTRLFGQKPLYRRDGATIPALASMQQALGLETTVFGWGLAENIHAPNERLAVVQYETGRRAWCDLLQEIRDMWVQEQAGGGTAASAGTGTAADDSDSDKSSDESSGGGAGDDSSGSHDEL